MGHHLDEGQQIIPSAFTTKSGKGAWNYCYTQQALRARPTVAYNVAFNHI